MTVKTGSLLAAPLMRKNIIVVFTIVFVAIVFTGCYKIVDVETNNQSSIIDLTTPIESTEIHHNHNYIQTIVDPTCGGVGYTIYTCVNCNDIYKSHKTISVNHCYGEYKSNNDSTCTQDGTITATCRFCSQKHTVIENGSAIGHQYVVSVVNPTVDSAGYTMHVCQTCGETFKNNYVDKLAKEYINLNNYQTVVSYNGLKEIETQICKCLISEYERYKSGETNEICFYTDEKIGTNGYYRIVGFFAIYIGNYTKCNELVNVVMDGVSGKIKWWLDAELFNEFMQDKMVVASHLEEALMGFTEGSEEHKLRQIADWLKDNFTYKEKQLDAYSSLQTKTANCNGFAFLFQMMASRIGIECDLCIGYAKSEFHAWNRVTLSNGKYRFYDVCFYNSNGNTKYLHVTKSPWEKYTINDYWNI